MKPENLDDLYRQTTMGWDEPGEMIMNGQHLKYMARTCWGEGKDLELADIEGNPIKDSTVYLVTKRGIAEMEID
jgi:hypothetical protein